MLTSLNSQAILARNTEKTELYSLNYIITPGMAIKTRRFWMLTAMIFNMMFYLNYILTVFRLWAPSVDPKVLTLTASIGAIISATSRIFAGYVQDS
jgi:hypothetical protein